MSPDVTAILMTALLAKREELLRQIRSRDAIEIERVADPMDAIQPLVEREANALRMDRASKQLLDVDAAIARINAGAWGSCEDCDEPIKPRRLELLPWAARCVPCQEREDARALVEAADDGDRGSV